MNTRRSAIEEEQQNQKSGKIKVFNTIFSVRCSTFAYSVVLSKLVIFEPIAQLLENKDAISFLYS
jgi:hypothetical protein